MRLGDFVLVIILVMLGLYINDPGIFSVQNLLIFGIVLAVIIIIAISVLRDYTPVLKLRRAEAVYAEDYDEEKLFAAIEEYKATNRVLSNQYKAYMMEAQLHMYRAEYTDALDALLYCDKKDMDSAARLHFLILKARILTFMGVIEEHHDIFTAIKESHSAMTLSDRFGYLLARGYTDIMNGNMDNAEKKLTLLNSILADRPYKSVILENEVRWFESLLELARNRDELTYERQLNLLTTMKCKPYIIKNFAKSKEAMFQ